MAIMSHESYGRMAMIVTQKLWLPLAAVTFATPMATCATDRASIIQTSVAMSDVILLAALTMGDVIVLAPVTMGDVIVMAPVTMGDVIVLAPVTMGDGVILTTFRRKIFRRR